MSLIWLSSANFTCKARVSRLARAALLATMYIGLMVAYAKADCGSKVSTQSRTHKKRIASQAGPQSEAAVDLTIVNLKREAITGVEVSLENKRSKIHVNGRTNSKGRLYTALPVAGRYKMSMKAGKKRETIEHGLSSGLTRSMPAPLR